MSEIEHEIASQPTCWREAALRGTSFDDLLPAPGLRVGAVGCGTSLFMGQAYAWLREAAGRGETDAFPASEAPRRRRYDAVVAISRSGTTTEVLDYLRAEDGARHVALVGAADCPIAAAADASVTLEFADEHSVVQTRFATSALALLRAHLGEDLGPVIEQAEAAMDTDLPVEPGRFTQFVFLGTEWAAPLASEAALKFRETSQAWAESYPAMEFRHGPISPVDRDLLRDAAATGATVVGGDRDPMAELVVIQRSAASLAKARGLDPDHPRHLTRSVVLS